MLKTNLDAEYSGLASGKTNTQYVLLDIFPNTFATNVPTQAHTQKNTQTQEN